MDSRVDELTEILLQRAEAEGYTTEDLAYGVAVLAAGLLVMAEIENGFNVAFAMSEVES